MKRPSVFGIAIFIFSLFFQSPFAQADRGQALYNLCSKCHGPTGSGNQKLAAPAIAGLPQWYIEGQLKKFKSGVRGKNAKYAPGLRMGPMARTLRREGDIEAVAKYVSGMPSKKPLPTVQGDPERGKIKYATCQACHGATGMGLQALNAPPLKNQKDWYLLSQLKNFKAGIRGGNPAVDPTGSIMAPMANTLEDEQAMKDVLAYIQSME